MDEFQGGGCAGDYFSVEARIPAGVAGSGADLFYYKNDGVLITIGADFYDFLDVAGGFPFVPDFGAGA